jgi:hypothetical protein
MALTRPVTVLQYLVFEFIEHTLLQVLEAQVGGLEPEQVRTSIAKSVLQLHWQLLDCQKHCHMQPPVPRSGPLQPAAIIAAQALTKGLWNPVHEQSQRPSRCLNISENGFVGRGCTPCASMPAFALTMQTLQCGSMPKACAVCSGAVEHFLETKHWVVLHACNVALTVWCGRRSGSTFISW